MGSVEQAEGFPGRLAKAIRWWRGETGVSAFAREMKAREVRGGSRGMIHHYLAGDHAPPLDFMQAAADLLGVRLAWLAANDGSPWVTRPQVAPGTKAGVRWARLEEWDAIQRETVEAALRKRAPSWADFVSAHRYQGLVNQFCVLLQSSPQLTAYTADHLESWVFEGAGSPEEFRAVAAPISETIAAVVGAADQLIPGGFEGLSDREKGAYLSLALPALEVLAEAVVARGMERMVHLDFSKGDHGEA